MHKFLNKCLQMIAKKTTKTWKILHQCRMHHTSIQLYTVWSVCRSTRPMLHQIYLLFRGWMFYTKNCFLRNLLINVRPAYFLMLQNRKVAKFLHPTFLIFLYHINHRQNVNNMNNTRGRINIYATETNVFRWNGHLQHYVKTCSQNINLKISINCRTVYLHSC